MSAILGYLYVAAAVVFLFGAAIFVHEFGHYWMARRRGMKIEAFAIGFGPKVFGWTRDGIEYSVRWIPAGGYVKLPQMVTSEMLEGGQEQETIPPASPFSKILVAFAGPLMNVVFAFAMATLIYFVGLPVLINPPVIGPVDPESAEGKLGIRDGDRIVAVDGKPVRSWQDINFRTATARSSVIPVSIARNGVTNEYELTARKNEVLSLKLLNLEPHERPVIGVLEKGMPAQAAGLQVGDKFLAYGGVPVLSEAHLVELIHKSEGVASEVEVERQGRRMAFTVTPKFDPDTKRGRIGIAFAGGIYMVQRPGPTPWEHIVDVVDKTVSVLGALIYSRQSGVKPSDLSGPVGIFGALAINLKTDYRLALSFMVLLNVNLAILNLLPVPVLDGGHIIMAVAERVRRRPLSRKFVEYTTTAFAVLLVSFMLYVTFFDIKRIPLFRGMFERQIRIEQAGPPAPPPEPPVLTPAR
jgi:regulator of sigma E protease